MIARHPVFVAVVGPTGSGKSRLALELAKGLSGEIVSCDALQVYRGLDIGTAKLGLSEREGIEHHLMDVVEPVEEFSAAKFVALAAPLIQSISRRDRMPLVVGGTGLYLRALMYGLFDGPGRSPTLRHRLSALCQRYGSARLHRLLQRVDPGSATRVHPNDRVRCIRALEVFFSTGRPMSQLMAARESPLPGFSAILLGLSPSREVLVRRIEKRVHDMFSAGFLAEVEGLLAAHGETAVAFKAIGYREAVRVLQGEIGRSEAESLICRATARYAKRQMTWFRREQGVHWFQGCGDDPAVLEEARSRVKLRLRELPAGADAIFPLETLHAETAS